MPKKQSIFTQAPPFLNNPMNIRIVTLSFLWFATAAVSGCKEPADAPVVEKFTITDSLINRLLIDTVEQSNKVSDLIFSAKITAEEEGMAVIFPTVSGRVNNVSVKLGDLVSKGQVLATITSAEMAEYDKEAITSSAELRNAERNLEQAQELFNSGLSSARELEEAKNEFLIKQAEDKRARAILKLHGGSSKGTYSIPSPLTGYVIEKDVNSNMQLRADNNSSLFTIADLSRVSAIVNIYESDIPRISEGDEVKIGILSYPDREFSGKIDKIYNVLDGESKVMNARVSIDNPQLLLKPGMLATVSISAKSGIDLPVVNSRGIIFDENKNYVLTLNPSNKVEIKEVQINRKATGKAYISKGLVAGDRIIASRQVFLYETLKN